MFFSRVQVNSEKCGGVISRAVILLFVAVFTPGIQFGGISIQVYNKNKSVLTGKII